MSIASENATRIPPMPLPIRLQLAREWRGHSQAELAGALDVSRATISNYERGIGKKGISKLQLNAWAAFCDVDVEWLKTGHSDVEPTPGGGKLPDLDSNQKPIVFKPASIMKARNRRHPLVAAA